MLRICGWVTRGNEVIYYFFCKILNKYSFYTNWNLQSRKLYTWLLWKRPSLVCNSSLCTAGEYAGRRSALAPDGLRQEADFHGGVQRHPGRVPGEAANNPRCWVQPSVGGADAVRSERRRRGAALDPIRRRKWLLQRTQASHRLSAPTWNHPN